MYLEPFLISQNIWQLWILILAKQQLPEDYSQLAVLQMGHVPSDSLTTVPSLVYSCPASPINIYLDSLGIGTYHLCYKRELYNFISWQGESTFCSKKLMIVIRSKKLNIDTFWNCQRLFNTLCASSNTVLLTTLLPQIYYSDLIHKPIWIHLCSLAPMGTKELSSSARLVLFCS